MLSQHHETSRCLLLVSPVVHQQYLGMISPLTRAVFSVFRRATCFGGGDDDDYDQEAGGKVESDRKYRKVGSSFSV